MYYLRQQTRISGPYAVEELKALLHRGRVARSDKISIDKQAWIPISACAEICHRPAAVTQPAAVGPVDDGIEWFYTLGGAEQPAGVGTAAIKSLIAAGSLGGDELVWRQGFDDWRPLHTVADFAGDFAAHGASGPEGSGGPSSDAAQIPPMPQASGKKKRGWF